MKPVGADEIRELDRSAIRDYSIPSLLLMENAGRSVSDHISREYKPCRVLIFIGKGNNGGDGLVAARHLANSGYSVRIALLTDPVQFKTDPRLNFSIVCRMNIPRVRIAAFSEEKILGLCRKSELLVDAIFGVGVRRPVCGIFKKAIRAVNRSQKPVVSVDIPSGLDADTGKVHGVAVKATKTITLSLPKHGLFGGDGPQYVGEIEVVGIGIPRELLSPFLD